MAEIIFGYFAFCHQSQPFFISIHSFNGVPIFSIRFFIANSSGVSIVHGRRLKNPCAQTFILMKNSKENNPLCTESYTNKLLLYIQPFALLLIVTAHAKSNDLLAIVPTQKASKAWPKFILLQKILVSY